MTADNLTFSIEIDFIPDIQDGRAELKKSMKSVKDHRTFPAAMGDTASAVRMRP